MIQLYIMSITMQKIYYFLILLYFLKFIMFPLIHNSNLKTLYKTNKKYELSLIN